MTLTDQPVQPVLPAGLKVLVVGINYPPEHTGIGPYTGQIAEHLAAVGCRVEVLTGVPHYPAWSVSQGYSGIWRRRETLNGVTVRRLRHYVPKNQSALRRALYEFTFLLQSLTVRPSTRPDVVLAMSPSLSSAAAANAQARRAGVPSVLIVQDLMGAAAAQSGIEGGARVAEVANAIEGRILRQAGQVGVIHPTFVPRVTGMGVEPDRVHLVPNWSHIRTPKSDRAEVRRRLGWQPDEIIVLHAGNLGLKQGVEVAVDAARLAAESGRPVRVQLLGDGNQKAHLVSYAGSLPTVDFLPPVDDAEFPEVLAAADILLVTQKASVQDMSIPSKLTSYFAAGRPVIASVAEGGTADEVRRAEAGLVVTAEDPAALLAAIEQLGTDRDLGEQFGRAGQNYAQNVLSQAAGLARVDGLLCAALAGGRGAVDREQLGADRLDREPVAD